MYDYGRSFRKSLTYPGKHNQNDFFYLVHPLNWDDKISPREIDDKLNQLRDSDQFYKAHLIASLSKEAAIRRLGYENGKVYHTEIRGNIGLVIYPCLGPNNGIVQIAWNCDLNSPDNQKELKEFVEEHSGKIKSPSTLLTEAKGHENKYNELILSGHENIDILGIVYKSGDPKTKYIGRLFKDVFSKIMQDEIPLVELPAIENYSKNPTKDILENAIALSEFYEPEYSRTAAN